MKAKPLSLITPPTEPTKEALEVTWISHVLVPLAQNLAGGAAVAGLYWIGYEASKTWVDLGAEPDVVWLWAKLAGGAVACAATFVRFFADDFGIVTAAYRAGQRSRDAEINALQLELQAAVATANLDPTSAQRRRTEVVQRARKDAERLLEVHFGGDSTARSAMVSRGMGQRDWERAMRLLRAAGAMSEDGVMIAKSPRQAIKAIEARLTHDQEHGGSFTPAWQ